MKNCVQDVIRLWYGCLRIFFAKGAEVGTPKLLQQAEVSDAASSEVERGLALLRQGNLEEAESIYRAILQVSPDQSEALHLLGVVQAQRQRLPEAAELIGRALELDPDNRAAHVNLGNVFKALRRNEDALVSYDRALLLDCDSADALNNRGAVLGELRRHEEALASYDRALSINADYAEAQLNRSVSLAALGRHQEALESYDRALAKDPNQVDAWIARGFSLAALARNDEALASFDHALILAPTHFAAHSERGSLLVALGRRDEALASYERALSINPDHADALLNRGNVFVSIGRHEEALASYDRVLAVKPACREALLKRCATLVILKQLDQALMGYDQLLAINADDIEVLFNRGILLVELKRYADAVNSYDKALAAKPDFVEALYNRGIAFWHAKMYEEAVASYDRALAIRADYADAWYSRGVALGCLNRKAEAVVSYDRAVELNPEFAAAFNNRGSLLADMRQYDEALASFDRALAIMPDMVETIANRGGVFRAMELYERAAQDYSRLLELAPEYEYALGNKFSSDLDACNWRDYRAIEKRILDGVRNGKLVSYPYSVLVESNSILEQLQCARTFASRKHPVSASPLWSGERYQHQRIRLAYLSADFHGHATSYLMAELFETHDRKKFEVTAWSFGPEANDGMRDRLRKSFDQFIDVRKITDEEVSAMLREREIDIAVDLKGYTNGNRAGIFAYRAAPIQVNYLVYPGTMGADFIDYIVGDSVVIPHGHDEFYAEKVVRLPGTYQVNDSKRVISEKTPSRSECKLPQSGFVFCCFNKNRKIVPEIFDIWMQLLKKVEGSVLWLFEGNTSATRNLRAEAESRGVRGDRLVFATHTSLADHLARHRLADLFLDTLPCNAHTTASDALWAGLPVLTCLGNTFSGRVAGSLLQAIGLPELIADNLSDYETLALKLATTPALLADIRSRLERNRITHPLFDIDRCRRHVESAYITMYERYQRGELPQSFSVPRIS